MGQFDKFLSRVCKQTAVYWGTPVVDGYGGKTYATPVEIYCRWEDKTQVLSDLVVPGDKIISRAVVYTLQNIDPEGLLYLGTLESLAAYEASDGSIDDPSEIANICIIKRVEISLSVNNEETLRKAFLTPWLT